jgi:serine protease Do
MSRRSILTAIALISTGIVFGAILVTGFSGTGLSLAGPAVSFNSSAPVSPSAEVAGLNETFQQVASVATPQVVYIEVKSKVKAGDQMQQWPYHWFQQPQGAPEDQIERGSGSGIILTQDGYILTNRHVVADAMEGGIKVKLYDTREFDAELVGEDENTDIAVIRIKTSGLSPAALGNSDDPKVGEWVLAVGNPLGLNSTVTAGIVSAISRNIGILGDETNFGIENFIQTDAAINPGNSGGALVNLNGQVIGVISAIAGGRDGRYIGYGFAVPINLARVVAEALIKNGKFVRGYIGVRISDLDAQKASALGLDRFHGVLVESLVEDGAGKKAGLQAGDAIVEVDGKPVESSNQLQARVGMHHPGESVSLKIWRSGKYITKSVTLEGRDNEEAEAKPTRLAPKDNDDETKTASFISENTGLTVKQLTSRQRTQFSVDGGVMISDVKVNGRAWESNLRAGLVIFEAVHKGNKVSIGSVSEYRSFVASVKSGESVLLRVKTERGDAFFVTMKAPLD